jgi:fumarylacetoacetase
MILNIAADSHFSIHNLPFGIFSASDRSARPGVAIGEHIIDLQALASKGVFDFDTRVFESAVLNDFIALGKPVTNSVREQLQKWLRDPQSVLAQNQDQILVAQKDAQMHLPLSIGDYTDFYSSIEHATNVGIMFRDPANALLPNWKHLPVGYHGRASSIVVSGTPVRRPKGQVLPKDATAPVFQASGRLDFELEMAFVTGKPNAMGTSITTDAAEDHIFGLMLFNDWSARDIQKWEYVPLGPFLAKNFASTVSPWIVTLEALEPFRVAGPEQDPAVLPYLQYQGNKNYDIQLEVSITPQSSTPKTVCRSNFKYMYWNMAQQLAHHTVNGCNIEVGDLLASGTISGPEEDSYGSMLELAWMGTKPLTMPDGSSRTFIQDGDVVRMTGWAQKDDIKVGFGEVTAAVLPAIL